MPQFYSRWLQLCFVFMMSVCSVIASRCSGIEDGLVAIGVERSLPVVGRSIRLWACRLAADEATPPLEGEVRFFVQASGEKTPEVVGRVPAEFSHANFVETQWTPKVLGTHAVWCDLPGSGTRSDVKEVFVTPHTIHINVPNCSENQRWVTSRFAPAPPDRNAKDACFWRRRGVLPLRWKNGHWSKTSEAYAKYLADLKPHHAGVMIDELGPDSLIAAQGIKVLKSKKPDIFIAAYCVVVGNREIAAALRYADVILLECYTRDWRGYKGMSKRIESAIRQGLGDKTIAVLGLGGWITTEHELRRQIAYIRSNYPSMPGIAFFQGRTEYLKKSFDQAVYDYFLAPAVLLTMDADRRMATVKNIGCLPAKNVHILQGLGQDEGLFRGIPSLAPSESVSFNVPDGIEAVSLRHAPQRYTVVEYEDSSRLPPLDTEAAARALQYRKQFADGMVFEPLTEALDLLILRAHTKDESRSGAVGGGTLPLPPFEAHEYAVALSFDIDFGRSWFDAHVGVQLAGGRGSLGFQFSNAQAGDSISPNDMSRVVFTFESADGVPTRETCPIPLDTSQKYRLFASYSPRGNIRGMLVDEDGNLLWDTGSRFVEGEFRPSHLRFAVRPMEGNKGSEIRWDKEEGRIFLRGVAHRPKSPYILEAWISDLRVSYPERYETFFWGLPLDDTHIPHM